MEQNNIIKEMMDIVSKRDSLITLLEEDRLRCPLNRYRSHSSYTFSSTLDSTQYASQHTYLSTLSIMLCAYVMFVLCIHFTMYTF